MSLIAALVFLTQSAVPVASDAPARLPLAERVTASVRVLRPARISYESAAEAVEDERVRNVEVQRDRDAAGTVWIEFN